MNKNRYRIIYNKARQMFMAVAENAKSQTKNSGQSTRTIAETTDQAFHQLWQVKALVASMSLWMPLSTVYAGMVADPGANAANRPVIGVGQNTQKQNVPVINIQTPNAGGVSHNIYKEFDVPTQGAVLNNSRVGATSSIVGSVGANPYLQKGEARVILNEVNSAIASKFEGNLEIAGQRADLIIANPAGINIKGGGFINANKAILTTGKPQFNTDGSIKEFIVDQGKITISANAGSNLGLGGTANNNANYVDIYTRALELNAQVHANNDIQVITGANSISADLTKVEAKTSTAAAPSIAIDVKALGGMYANNIYLMGTEKGLGVNNAGTLQALNNLVVTSAGKIEHSGTISSTSKTQGLVSISTTEAGASGDVNSSGSINSNSILNIDSANNLNVNAKDILINYGGVASSPLLINTKGNLNLAANTRIMNDSQGGDLYVNAANINLGTNSELKSNRSSAIIQAQQGLTTGANARLIAALDLNVSGKGKLSLTGAGNLLHATLGSINLQAGSSNIQGLIDIQSSTINAGKDLNLSSSGDINIKNLGLVLENGTSRLKSINAYSGQNLKWYNSSVKLPQITGKVQINAVGGADLLGTALSANDDISITSNNLLINSKFQSNKNINFTTQQNINLNSGSSLNSGENIKIASLQGSIEAVSFGASAKGDLSLLANKNLKLYSQQSQIGDDNELYTAKASLAGEKGVVLGSVGDNGSLEIQAMNITSKEGEIQLISQNGIKISGNLDREMYGDDKLHDVMRGSEFDGKSIIIKNNKNDIDIKNGLLVSRLDKISIDSLKDQLVLKDSSLLSSGNVEISSGNKLSIANAVINSDKHLALSSKNRVYVNSSLDQNDERLTIIGGETKLNAKGIVSIVGEGESYINNIDAKGGAILIDVNDSIYSNNSVNLSTFDSDFLKKDSKLNELNGDVSIQSLESLSIIPGIHNIKSYGDLTLSSKSNVVLTGYGGSNGNGSEKIVNLETTNGDINIFGANVELNGSKLKASSSNSLIGKKINITSTSGDVIIKAVKNTANDYVSDRKVENLSRELSALDVQINNYKRDTANLDYQLLASMQLQRDIIYQGLEMMKTKGKAIEYSSAELLPWTQAYALGTGTPYWAKGDINIYSNGGVKLEGAVLDGLSVNIKAKGFLKEDPDGLNKKEILPNNVVLNKSPTSIFISSLLDEYEFGQAGSSNYGYATFNSPSYVTGSKSVNIETLGSNNGLTIVGSNVYGGIGGVNLSSSGDLRLEAVQEELYKYSSRTYKTGSWYKRKVVTETETYNLKDVTPTIITSSNDINISSNDNLTLVSTALQSYSGNINLNSGEYLRLWSKPSSQFSQIDVTKKSKLFGIKYNDSKNSSVRSVETELPAVFVAERNTNLSSGNTTWVKGTEFENKLGKVEIKAGVGDKAVADAQIILQDIITKVTDIQKKESNSVVWQSMQDKGSITETAKLPSFKGPTTPIFQAAGGLVVQIPVGEKDQNKVQLRDEIMKLANQPGNAYLKDFVNRNDVDWQKVILAQKDWDYKSQGLTAAGAAILAIAIAAISGGAGIGALLSTSGTVTNAALLSLTTQASISLINNGGDISATFKELGSKESIKTTITAAVTAGILDGVSTSLKIDLKGFPTAEKIANNFVQGVGTNIISSTLQGQSLSDSLESALLAGLSSSIQGELATKIKGLEDVDYVLHKIAHAAVGCVAGALQKSCEAGAIGGAIGEIVAESLLDGRNPTFLNSEEKSLIEGYSKLIAGTVTAYAGFDVNVAANSASVAIQNNAFKDKAIIKMEAAKKYLDDKSKGAIDEFINIYKKGDIKATQQAKNKLDDAIGNWASSGGYEVLGVNPKAVIGAMTYAVGEIFIPVNITDIGGGKKIVQEYIGQLGKAIKAINKAENGSITILAKATPDDNELRAGVALATKGYDVQHIPTASQLGIQDKRTADLIVSGLGKVDVFTPITKNPDSILRTISKKSDQAGGVLIQIDLPSADMSSIANRMWGKSDGKDIKLIIFQDASGNITQFKRP